jgi:thioredoxin reductase
VAGLGPEKPHPPGDYPVVVVGSGPGGLQASYSLSRLGVEHAVISTEDAPGGMFRLFPIYERLLSWTKLEAPCPVDSREYEWYDHNSLVAEEPENRGAMREFMGRTFMVPSREEMERGLAAFAKGTGLQVRYGCTWESTRRADDGSLVLTTTDGEYRCRAAVFALGVTTAWKSPIPGIEHVPHYSEASRDRDVYRGKRVFIVGKRNSAFELADGLEEWASKIVLASPRPAAVLSSVRARYLQPYEDWTLGGGTVVLDAAIERIERRADGFQIVAEGTTRPGRLELETDVVIAATGFTTPLRDLGTLGVQTVAQGRIPALTNFWESEKGSGIFFAGNATQGAAGLRKHGVGSASPAVHGFRYNAQVMARRLAATHLGVRVSRDKVKREELVSFLLHELTSAPELWAQKSYLARVVWGNGETEIFPLAEWLDRPQPDCVAVAVEENAQGEIYPAVYVASDGTVREHLLDPQHLHDFRGTEYQRRLAEIL